jgi:hypothetical protein
VVAAACAQSPEAVLFANAEACGFHPLTCKFFGSGWFSGRTGWGALPPPTEDEEAKAEAAALAKKIADEETKKKEAEGKNKKKKKKKKH